MEIDDKINDHDPEWENRALCPDGSCIGVIGPDGKCKECGISSDYPSEGAPKTSKTPNNIAYSNTQDAESDPLWENRTLCPDGNCIGIIGPDGRCKECGKEG